MTTRSPALLIVSLAFFAGCQKAPCPEGQERAGDVCIDIIDTDEGENTPPTADVDPCEIEFGEVEANTTTSETVKITNNGGLELHVQSITVDEPAFAPQASAATIGGHSSYQFLVRFTPTSFGDYTGTMTITPADADGIAPTVCTLHGTVRGDVDGDGFIDVDAGGDDCDDTDANTYPGAPEIWYNGNDEDCSGGSDFDQDGDGWESEAFNPDVSAGGGDCQDRKAEINPGETEIYYDGTDADCSGGNDYDADGDGEKSADYGGTDCNDLDATVNSEGVEAYDGLDNDCDGAIDNGVESTSDDMTITGDDVTYSTGNSLAIGDFDDDGKDELVVGMKYYNWSSTGRPDAMGDSGGAVAVFSQSDLYDGVTTSGASVFFEGEETVDEFGAAVANLGDVDEDGLPDLAVGASSRGSKRTGSIYLFSGPDVAGSDPADAFAILDGSEGYRFGLNVSSMMDVDGDGAMDVIGWGIDTYYAYNYMALEYGGSDLTGEIAWGDLDATYYGKCASIGKGSTGDHCEGSLTTIGGSTYWITNAGSKADFDGDGYDDVLMADPYWDVDDGTTGQANHGRVWTLPGKSSRYSASNSNIDGVARAMFSGDLHKQYLGQAVGVVPGNGGPDGVLVLDPDAEVMYYHEGSSDLITGALDLETDAVATFDAADTYNGFVNIGDWSGDGNDDIGVLSTDQGYIALLTTGGWSGAMGELDENPMILASIVGATDYDDFGGAAPQFAGDLDSDGQPDLVVSDWQYDDERGSVHIFFNP